MVEEVAARSQAAVEVDCSCTAEEERASRIGQGEDPEEEAADSILPAEAGVLRHTGMLAVCDLAPSTLFRMQDLILTAIWRLIASSVRHSQ